MTGMGQGFSLEGFYDAYPRIEGEFRADLDHSLGPRGPDCLFQLVAGLGLPAGSAVLDIGCGEGADTLRLAEQFGFAATGIDPVPRHISLALEGLSRLPHLRDDAAFRLGTAEALPVADASVELIWCKEALSHVAALDTVLGEFRRVLRQPGRVILYQMFATDRLEPNEAAWLFTTMGVAPSSTDPAETERAIAAAGLQVDQCVVIGSEFGERAEEHAHEPARQLLHAARLLRAPDRYIAKFGRPAYDIMLGDCLWHIYGMIGKLSRRVYVLSR
jgi:SAM-dependent methyltransferase